VSLEFFNNQAEFILQLHASGQLKSMHVKAFPTLYQAYVSIIPLQNETVTKMKVILLKDYILPDLDDNTYDKDILNLLRLLQLEYQGE